MIRFLFSRTFLIQLVLALLLIGLCIGGTYYYLLSYTKLGESIEVPNLTGYDIIEAEAELKQLDLQLEVIDSLYQPGKRGGEIVDQQPIPTSLVKSNRKIYLTISRYSTPMKELPNVTEQTTAIAIAKLTSYRFKIGELSHKASNYCSDCVLAVKVKDKVIEPGTRLREGQTVDLVVGQESTGELVSVPMVYGLSETEAQKLLNMHNLNLGAAPYDEDCVTKADSVAARVYRQSPEENEMLPIGSNVNVFLASDLSKIPEGINIDSIKGATK